MENRKARRIVISKNSKIKNLEKEYLGSWAVLVIISAVIHKDVDSSTVRLSWSNCQVTSFSYISQRNKPLTAFFTTQVLFIQFGTNSHTLNKCIITIWMCYTTPCYCIFLLILRWSPSAASVVQRYQLFNKYSRKRKRTCIQIT